MKRKNIWLLLMATTAIAACGSSDSNNPAPPPPVQNPPPAPPPPPPPPPPPSGSIQDRFGSVFAMIFGKPRNSEPTDIPDNSNIITVNRTAEPIDF